MQDRRLQQDDNRGLGQGVLDNQPVLNIFKLMLENVSPCKKRSNNYPSGYLTPPMHQEMNRLLYPMQKLVWHENDWVGVLPSFGKSRESLDIGTEIAVLRNLKHVPVSAKNKKSTIGLVLNRHYLEQCDQDFKSNEEAVSKMVFQALFQLRSKFIVTFLFLQVNIHRILGLDEKTEIFDSALTLLSKKSQIPSSSVDICPMEIKAFIVNR